MSLGLDTPEAKEAAARLNAYKHEVIHERWLSTLILCIHLELEACLEVLLCSFSHRAVMSPSNARYTSCYLIVKVSTLLRLTLWAHSGRSTN